MTNIQAKLGAFYHLTGHQGVKGSVWLYERGIVATKCGLVIVDIRQPDHPIIYCNPAFESITGYSSEEAIGRNCRFLQGSDTDPAAVEQIRQALRTEQECQVVIKNYRKDGTPFWNELTVSPLRDIDGGVSHYIGIQADVTERQQAEETQQLMQFSMEHVADAVFWIKSDARLFYVNKAACQSLGYSCQQLLFLKVHDIDMDLSADGWLHHWQQLKQHRSLTFESRHRTSEGRIFPVEIRANYLEFNGQEYICAFARDISERKQAEAQLREQAERERILGGITQRIRQSLNLEAVLNTAVEEVRQFLQTDRVLLYRFEPDWSGVVVVESTTAGLQPILGRNIKDPCFQEKYIQPYRQGRIRAINDIYTADIQPCHVKLLSQFQVRANLVVPVLQNHPEATDSAESSPENSQLWGLLVAHHCSDRREWKESEVELLRQLSLQLAIAIQQSTLVEQLKAELAERQQAEAALRKSEAQLREQATQLKQTLQELQQTQSQLVQAEKMSSLGQLVAGVAHEINNPVSFIYGNLTPAMRYAEDLLQLLRLYQEHYPLANPEIQTQADAIDLNFLVEDFPKLLASMKIGADRIRDLVKSLRNFSRHDQTQKKRVDIHEGIENTLLILQHRLKEVKDLGIQVVKEYGDLPKVECYAGQLNQVFMNLISNAIDALESQPEPRIIKIHTEVSERSELGTLGWEGNQTSTLNTQSSKGIVIRISDNGPGIPESLKQRIFDPFFTTKPVGQGTGLGLSISYQIVVERHGGQLLCLSTPGEGTEFIVEIPLQDTVQESTKPLDVSAE